MKPELASVDLSATKLASQARRTSALICDALADTELLHASRYPISFATFAAACRRFRPQTDMILVTSVEIHQMLWSTIPVVQATTGFLGHQYVVVTLLLPDGRSTFIKADYLVENHSRAASKLILTFDDDRNALTRDSHLLARVSAPESSRADPSANGSTSPPTLTALAALFEVADARLGTRPYDVLGRNCLWIADALFYALAQRYAAHWRAGEVAPDAPLRRYLRGTAGTLETLVSCTLPTAGGWARGCVWGAAYAVRWVLVLCSARKTGADRWVMHDEEVAQWMSEWAEREQV